MISVSGLFSALVAFISMQNLQRENTFTTAAVDSVYYQGFRNPAPKAIAPFTPLEFFEPAKISNCTLRAPMGFAAGWRSAAPQYYAENLLSFPYLITQKHPQFGIAAIIDSTSITPTTLPASTLSTSTPSAPAVLRVSPNTELSANYA